MLLIGTGLMIRSFIALQSIDPGWDPRGVISMVVSTAGTPAADSTRHESFYLEALDRVRAVPGVEAASWINHRPIDGDEWGFPFRLEGQPIPRPGESPTATYRVVAPGYFETMRIPILRGRDIHASDRADAPGVVVINEFMAKKHWPGRDPIGQRLTIDGKAWLTVIGLAKNDVREQWSAPAEEEFFLPFAQERSYAQGRGASRTMTLVARASCRKAPCSAGDLAAPIRTAIRSVERGAPISAVTSMTALVDSATAEPRFYLLLLAGFAAIAVLLAAVGIYGVMSFAVSRRLHEIGIRIALGARPSSVMRDVVTQGLGVASAGAGAGLAASLALSRLMRGVLYGVRPTDALTFILVTGLLLLVAAVATLLPARRATRVDPLVALRAE
jgi:putative ABC transport system permease protein